MTDKTLNTELPLTLAGGIAASRTESGVRLTLNGKSLDLPNWNLWGAATAARLLTRDGLSPERVFAAFTN